MANILVIDDDKNLCTSLAELIDSLGYFVTYALRLKEGLDKARSGLFDLVFLDIHLPDGNGLKAVPHFQKNSDSPEIIIITGEGEPDGAEIAIRHGCWDYIQKPLSVGEIKLQLTRVLQYRVEKSNKQTAIALKREGILGKSSQMRACFDIMAKACQTNTSVLITGETGTGKELFARAIHDNSNRAGETFVVVDCASLPETLVESTLFGYEKGAFTGADQHRNGLVREAHQGTLFLDEVGELPVHIQGSFLRVLQEQRFRPVGGEKEVKSEFRLIAATNRNVNEMVQKGEFRKDLLFRLQTIVVEMPPLRDRSEDIKELAFYYMNKFCDRFNIETKGVSPEFFETLTTYQWPGNVRELINALESALSMARDEHTLFPIHLPPHIRVQQARASVKSKSVERITEDGGGFPNFRERIESTERQYLQNLMTSTDGNIKAMCRISGLSRGHIYRLLKKYNITRHV